MIEYPELFLLIDGKWRRKPDHLPVVNPADHTVIGKVPVASMSNLDDALAAADRGFRTWRRTPLRSAPPS